MILFTTRFDIITFIRNLNLFIIMLVLQLWKTREVFWETILFCLSTVIEWNSSNPSITNAESYNLLKNIVKVLRPSPNSAYDCHIPRGVEFVTRLCLDHLREHKFKHSFYDSLNQVCNYVCDVELTPLFFLFYSSSVDRASNTHILNSTTGHILSAMIFEAHFSNLLLLFNIGINIKMSHAHCI